MKRLLTVGALCALIAGAIAAWADGLTVPFSMPATTCSNQFVRSIAVTTGVGTCASIVTADFTTTRGQYLGTNTNDNATAGNIGEYVESVIAFGSEVAITSSTAKNLTSIPLTAGDWDVRCAITYTPAGGTITTATQASASLTTDTRDATASRLSAGAVGPAGTVSIGASVNSVRFSLASSSTMYCVGFSVFSVSTMGMAGSLSARRMR